MAAIPSESSLRFTKREQGHLGYPGEDELAFTRKLNIIPLSVCSAIWQWAIQSPGLVT